MLAKLVVEGKEFDIEILDPKLQELIAPKKKTGYERLNSNCSYWTEDEFGVIEHVCGEDEEIVEEIYKNAKYYSSEILAENNVRADTLMRQLRRFAVEHRKQDLDWDDDETPKWSIYYNYYSNGLDRWDIYNNKEFGAIYFDSEHTADLAIGTFRDELIWYFTEYKDSL